MEGLFYGKFKTPLLNKERGFLFIIGWKRVNEWLEMGV
jgi:hypothetical protein